MQRHPRLQQIMSVLLRLWDAFELPPNPLDHLTELLGGPDQVQKQSPQLPALWPCLPQLDCGRIPSAHQPVSDACSPVAWAHQEARKSMSLGGA